jgi:hypothetical protein
MIALLVRQSGIENEVRAALRAERKLGNCPRHLPWLASSPPADQGIGADMSKPGVRTASDPNKTGAAIAANPRSKRPKPT